MKPLRKDLHHKHFIHLSPVVTKKTSGPFQFIFKHLPSQLSNMLSLSFLFHKNFSEKKNIYIFNTVFIIDPLLSHYDNSSHLAIQFPLYFQLLNTVLLSVPERILSMWI